ncbi:desulfoferrodoxin [Thermosipho atlanticus]|uniref:Desulfoferrodoxin n=1 Tax=Thermosipho atlanticus DSM 15807 TaxID=1123380 RepID=A0A1M5QUI2_9BACT|nr:desulfoferrodoxin [Thermosipho atlanticus]SHH17752.1 superoxide reductase [Thermosipho atlanticus DSM 15807]
MTKSGQVYKCEICGNIVEVIHAGEGILVCCGQSMTLLEEKTAESSQEKHVPFIQEVTEGYLVKVGENIFHPMEEKHYIEWIELVVDGMVFKKYLNPGDKPEVLFKVDKGKEVYAREYCNVHGLWRSK